MAIDSVGLNRLYSGTHNFVSQEWQADGTVILTMSSHGDDGVIVMHVQDLYGPSETVLSEVTKVTAVPDYISKRLQEAQAWQAAQLSQTLPSTSTLPISTAASAHAAGR